jgi:Holliday junction DNA helicase RuvA
MYDYISGKLVAKSPERAVIDVQGVGYVCRIATSSYQSLPNVGEEAKLFTYTYVREDALELFGFAQEGQRAFFEVLLKVSGIGPRLALSALSTMQPGRLRDAIANGDNGMLTEISGVGRKTADRMIVELRDKVTDLDIDGTPGTASEKKAEENAEIRADARSALVELGLSRAAAERSLRKALRDSAGVDSAEELIRLALRHQS